jgi:hypothetical protein
MSDTRSPRPPQVHPVIATRARTLALVAELSAAGVEDAQCLPPGEHPGEGWEWLPESAVRSGTGLAVVRTRNASQVAIAPPFPFAARQPGLGALVDLLEARRSVGIVLLRLGHYAVAVAEDEALVSPKSGHRYVHGRHRAGGQSQHRYEHNREVWMRELFDEACEAAVTRFREYCRGRPDARAGLSKAPGAATGSGLACLEWLTLGGDSNVLKAFLDRCDELETLGQRIVPWRVPVERPGADALGRAAVLVWSSRVYTQAGQA